MRPLPVELPEEARAEGDDADDVRGPDGKSE